MDRPGFPVNQHRYTQTEGGIPTSGKPTLIARSPYKYLGDMERDMDRNSSKKPAAQAQPLGHHTKSVNPRGPHYSGTHSQHGSSSSSHSSLSDSSSGYSRQTENGSQILRQEDHRLTNQGQYGHQYAARPGDPGYYQHSDVRHAGSTRQQYTAQYPGRTTSNYDNFVPASYYEQQRDYEHRQPYHHPHYRHISRERGPLVKAHSEETFRHERTNGSEKGFSSLGDLPPVHTPVYRQEHPMGQPLMTQYTYQTGPYRELSPTSTQYGHGSAAPTSTQYSHSTATAAYSSDVNRTDTLSERIEGMRIRLDDDNIEILKQPIDQAVNLHESMVFTCDARIVDCQEEPNLLWFKDQEPLIGEIDSTYVITETTEKDAGVYHCLVSHPLNPSQQKESTSATLTINTGAPKTTPPLVSLPEIVKQPLGTLAAVVGEPLEVTIQVSGDEPLSYQWYRNSQPLNFAQSSVLRFPIASITDSGDYCCRVANDHGSILSKVFTLEVTRVRVAVDLSDSYLQRVSVTIARQVRDIEELAPSLGVQLPDPTAYRSLGEQILHLLRIWRDTKNGTKKQLVSALKQLRIVLQDSEIIQGYGPSKDSDRSQGYGPSKDSDRSQGYGRSKDSDRIEGYGQSKDSDRSQGYGRSKTAKLQFLKQPQSAKVIYGQSVSLHVAVSLVTPSTTYQWYLNGSPLVGQTSSHFTISSVVDSDVGDYLCVVSGSETRIQSEPAVIELTEISHQRRGVPAPPPQTQVFEPPKRYLINRGVPADKDADLLLELRQLPVTKTESPPNIVIDEHPASVEIEPGDPLTLRCRASSSYGDIKYSWYFNGLLIEEEQSDYVLNFSTDEDEGYYTCKVSNQYGSVTSNTAQVKAKLDSD